MSNLLERNWLSLLLLMVLVSGCGMYNQASKPPSPTSTVVEQPPVQMTHAHTPISKQAKGQSLGVTPPPECGEYADTETEGDAGGAMGGLPANTDVAFTVVDNKRHTDKAVLVCKGGILVLVDHTLGNYGRGNAVKAIKVPEIHVKWADALLAEQLNSNRDPHISGDFDHARYGYYVRFGIAGIDEIGTVSGAHNPAFLQLAVRQYLQFYQALLTGKPPKLIEANGRKDGAIALLGKDARTFHIPDDVRVIKHYYDGKAIGADYQQVIHGVDVEQAILTARWRKPGNAISILGFHYPHLVPKNKVTLSSYRVRTIVARKVAGRREWLLKPQLLFDPRNERFFYKIRYIPYLTNGFKGQLPERLGNVHDYWIDAQTGKQIHPFSNY